MALSSRHRAGARHTHYDSHCPRKSSGECRSVASVSSDPLTPPRTDGEVRGYWQALGLPGLADIHVYFLPQRMLEKVWAFFDHAQERYGQPWPITYRHSEE